MANNSKDIKHTRYIYRIIDSVRNGAELNCHKTVWCEGSLKLADIGTNNVREDKLNPKLGYDVVRLDN